MELYNEDTSFDSGEVEEISVEKLTRVLEQFLERYLADARSAWKWIIISCIYLGFVKNKPFHAQELVQYQTCEEDGKTIYYCPAKAKEENTACYFCVCRFAEDEVSR